MKRILVLVGLLSACRQSETGAGNAAAPARGAAVVQGGSGAPGPVPAVAGLAGLYEGGQGPQRNQLCMVEKKGATQFGLLVWGAGLNSCSGAGDAVRKGERLTLRMSGDERCTIEARLDGDTITLPAALPAGCSYYCGAGARMAGSAFARTAAGEAEAMKAKDIAGDPLCG